MSKFKKVLIIVSISINILSLMAGASLINKKGGWKYITLKIESLTGKPVVNYSDESMDVINLYKRYPSSSNDIVFLGDSITASGEWSEYYPDKSCRNRGVGGDNTDSILLRLNDVINGKPKKIFLLAGINDIPRKNYEHMLDNFKQIIQNISSKSPNTKVYIESILPINKSILQTTFIADNEDIKLLNSKLKYLCLKYKIEFIDTFNSFLGTDGQLKTELTKEGIHLNSEGYLVLSEILKPYVLQ